MNAVGRIYLLHNCEYQKNTIKIGRTSINAGHRARQLRTTGVPREFIVLFSLEFEDAISAEKNLHRKFSDRRISPDREFFSVSPEVAIKAALEEAGYPIEAPAMLRTTDITQRLKEEYGPLLDESIIRIQIKQDSEQAMLVCQARRGAHEILVSRDLSTLIPSNLDSDLSAAFFALDPPELVESVPFFSSSGARLIRDIYLREGAADRTAIEVLVESIITAIRNEGLDINEIRRGLGFPEETSNIVTISEFLGEFIPSNCSNESLHDVSIQSETDREHDLESPRSYAIVTSDRIGLDTFSRRGQSVIDTPIAAHPQNTTKYELLVSLPLVNSFANISLSFLKQLGGTTL